MADVDVLEAVLLPDSVAVLFPPPCRSVTDDVGLEVPVEVFDAAIILEKSDMVPIGVLDVLSVDIVCVDP